MIHVDRSAVQRPPALDPMRPPANLEIQDATRFFATERNRQVRFDFRVYRSKGVIVALRELFRGKCAYCESHFGATSPGDIEHFRPKFGLTDRPDHPGYWWLASTWENLLINCVDCGRTRTHESGPSGKGNRFPLVNEKDRAFTPGQELHERPLLLDPCLDEPELHLVFLDNGTVVSETPRGQATISIVGLNRSGLVAARKSAASQLLLVAQSLPALQPSDRERFVRVLLEQTGPQVEYAALKRQVLQRHFGQWFGPIVPNVQRSALNDSTKVTTKAKTKRAQKSFRGFEEKQSRYSLADAKGQETYRFQRRVIERITLANVKAICKIDLDLTAARSETSWLMLLGENATGKSTVLAAIALALIGAEYFCRLLEQGAFHPSDFVRLGCKQGTIRVKLSGFRRPHELVLTRNSVVFRSPTNEVTTIRVRGTTARISGKGWEPQVVMLGYGATRLLPRGRTPPPGKGFARVNNLFDPFVPLTSADAWLLSLDEPRFDEVALVLKDLLQLHAKATLVRDGAQVFVLDALGKMPLGQLSDGYQSVVAMTIDLLEVVVRLWPGLRDAEGIVLLDELGNHLHPTWKMRIVSSLRRALPRMQFIATTHDPLCLRGLEKGEVVVMQRDNESGALALTGLPSPGDFRVDQLLTSEFFGLNSTEEPESEALFDEYYALLALARPSSAQRARLGTLKHELQDRRYLGATPREQLMYEVIDGLIAEQRHVKRLPLSEVKQEAIRRVSEAWNKDMKQGNPS